MTRSAFCCLDASMHMRRLSSVLLIAALVLPQWANAGSVALAPMLGPEPKATTNVTSLLASELSFMANIDRVIEVPKPAALTERCMSLPSCLGGIAKSSGADQLIVGNLTGGGDSYSLDLLLFDTKTGKTVRRKNFALPGSAEKLADKMNGVVRELLTDEATPEEVVARDPAPAKRSLEDDDDLEIEDSKPRARSTDLDDLDLEDLDEKEDPKEIAERQAEEERAAAVKKKEEETRAAAAKKKEEEAARVAAAKKKEEEEARAAEARRKAEEDARIAEEQRMAEERKALEAQRIADARAAEERRKAAETAKIEEARRREGVVTPPPEDDFDPSAITFGAPGSIEEIEDTIQFGASALEEVEDTETLPREAEVVAPKEELEKEELEKEELDDLDAEVPVKKSKAQLEEDLDEEEELDGPPKKSAGTGNSGSKKILAPTRVQIALRGGYSRYFGFNFITAGGELAVSPVKSLYLLGGVEVYSVRRQMPGDPEGLTVITQWNFIYPVNVGAVYKFGNGIAKPYIGADVIFAPYYYDADNKPSIAVGGRVRGGVDLMVVRNFGFNLNLSAGAWYGKDWSIVQPQVGSAGFLPQVSAGTVIAF